MPKSAIRPVRLHVQFIAAAALLVSCASLARGQVGPVRDQAPATAEATGTGRVTGQVIAADSGAPIKRAQVALTGGTLLRPTISVSGTSSPAANVGAAAAQPGGGLPPGMVRKQAETDESGRFDFTDLPAGQYSVVLMMPPVGFVRPDRPESVKVTDGQTATLTIKLGRTGAITGRVLDDSGEPLPRVNVRAVRRDSTTGGRTMSAGTGGPATTDDLGVFRLYGLPPGDYYVAGSYYNPQMPMSMGAATPGPQMGYGPTYYPGSVTLDGARRVTVRSGQDTPGIEFALQRVPLARIVGTAVDSAGRSLGNRTDGARGSVMIASQDEPNSARGSGFRPDGTFELAGLAPGEYEVFATLMIGNGPDAQREAVSMPVTINGADVTVNLQTNVGATLSGRVIVEGDTTPPVTPAGVPARVLPMTVGVRYDQNRMSFGTGFVRPAQVADDGTFELKGVRGSLFLFANGGRGVLKSVSRAGQDVTTKPMTFQGTERVTDVQIVMTTETGFVHGVVTDSSGQPATAAWVVIFPDDPERWFPQSPFVVTTRTRASIPPGAPQQMTTNPGGQMIATPGQGSTPRWAPVLGGFTVGRLLPGRYLVAAVADTNINMPATDRESLDKLRATATTVTVAVGDPAIVNLRLTK